ncbi:MAG TPA: hypothetical protein VH597_08010 [Verrucomicrobiae bacterium]|nr:hypothetical protein [Verrucomicrobiae bacterium]
MKTRLFRAPRKDLSKFCAILFASSCLITARAVADTNFVAHEWGTFTSVQGADGKPLPWHSSLTSELPGFVYDWKKPGLNRGALFHGKGDLITLQRMETPVIYFYADQPIHVDVNVAFPKGYITEWYPQATQIGPTFVLETNGPTKGILRDSRAIWRNLEIVPTSMDQSQPQNHLPQDSSGSHYFAARETASSLVRTHSASSADSTGEVEKFIFYRGAGSFKTPLHVSVDANNMLVVENTGPQPLRHLFAIEIRNGYGVFTEMDELTSSNSVVWLNADYVSSDSWIRYPIAQFPNAISGRMQAALTGEGLFPAEAKAMVNTWKDSWFTEEGVRILYILPRAWTDEILPMKLSPEPQDLTRVMVGRAELITPTVETNLVQLLTKAQTGDADARAQAVAEFKKLGRFAEPAFNLAAAHAHLAKALNLGDHLLYFPPATFE